MKLHQSVVEKIMRALDLYGGRKDNARLVQEIQSMDLSVYKQKENPRAQEFLVLTEELVKVPTK